jgi:hypothetical protein
MKEVIRKIFFDHPTFVAAADDKFVVTMRRVYIHNMP